MKIVITLKTGAVIKARIILLSTIFALPSLTTWADNAEETPPLLLALNNFDFDQFENNSGEVKTVSLGKEGNEIIPIKNASPKESTEKKTQPELKTEKSTTLVKEKEIILAQSWGKKSTSSSSSPASLSSSTSNESSFSNAPIYSQTSSTQQNTSLAPHAQAIGTANSPFGFHSYRLSYMQSDRILALLKALGYSTVEYSAGRGESINESIFNTYQQSYNYTIVVKILDAAKTSLMQPSLDVGFTPASATDRLSGTYLHQSTTGAPEQRLLIIYEKNKPEQLNALLNLMRNEVDVPASQIVIEALVIEIDTTEAKELGLKYNLYGKRDSHSFDGSSLDSKFNSDQSSLFGWNANRVTGNYKNNNYDAYGNFLGNSPVPIYGAMERANPLGFSAELKASVANGTAEVLSNPTILVLDGRQALIRVGTQIPNKTVVQTNYGSQESITYIDTGIVLNIRPRISEDGSEVTMQTETIVSTSRPYLNDAANPPEIESKTVQSFVRVADNTPFIIGGLIEKDKTDGRTGIPILSDIPVIGKLFQSTTKKEGSREVIIVLTPHIINTSEKSFSYVIPKDSESFDSFDNKLFRNA